MAVRITFHICINQSKNNRKIEDKYQDRNSRHRTPPRDISFSRRSRERVLCNVNVDVKRLTFHTHIYLHIDLSPFATAVSSQTSYILAYEWKMNFSSLVPQTNYLNCLLMLMFVSITNFDALIIFNLLRSSSIRPASYMLDVCYGCHHTTQPHIIIINIKRRLINFTCFSHRSLHSSHTSSAPNTHQTYQLSRSSQQ